VLRRLLQLMVSPRWGCQLVFVCSLCCEATLARALFHLLLMRPLPLCFAGTKVERLRAALPHAKEIQIAGEPEDGCSLLVLENAEGKPVDWPGLRSNKLFIRPVYREFYEREDMLNHMRHRKLGFARFSLVRGVPGIGKSSFALYCLWRLVKEGQHVLYSYPVGLGGAAAVVEFGSGVRDDAVFIADGTDGFAVDAGRRLLVTPPRQAYIAEFSKHAKPFYMPAPTTEELKLLRDTCFSDALEILRDDAVDARIRRWGCVPRYVLDHTDDEQQAFADTVGLLNVTALRNLLVQRTEIRDQQDVSFRVLHYDFPHEKAAREAATREEDAPTPTARYGWPLSPGVPLRDYTTVGLRWATPYMEDCV
jgi:hypothetical protein